MKWRIKPVNWSLTFNYKKKSQTSNDKQGHYNSRNDNETNKLSGTFIFFIPCILNGLKIICKILYA